MSMNPFCEIAVEEAIQLKEADVKAKKKDFDCQEAESLEFIADTIEDQDTTIKDDEVIYYKAKKIVPRQELKLGMER